MAKRPVHGGNLAWAAEIAGCSPGVLVDFSASINPLGPPDAVLAALQRAIPTLGHYPDPAYTDLRRALASHHDLSPDWILPGNGAAELLTWAARDIASQADPTAYLPTPAFNDYQRACQSFGATVSPWPLLSADPSAVLVLDPSTTPDQSLSSPPIPAVDLRVDALMVASPPTASCLMNNPHNPTGHLFRLDDLRPLLDHFSLVVVDEAFMDFLPAQEAPSLVPWVDRYPNLVVVRSLTKFYSLPGLRLGYAIGHPDRLQRWQQWRDPWPVNTLAVAAAMAAVQDTAFQAQTWAWLPPTRQALMAGLSAIPGFSPLPSAANYLLVKADTPVPPLQLRLLQHSQVLIRDCLSFAELGEHYFRVAVRSESENERLRTALIETRDL
ncbi:threonine-phosphate decarboxylase CobD [Phormidium sp. FACHB-1136]|jgi:L-threonine-O-3-phosphate decarboxylase|uniref:threonine-phosphate decarboxylase CobD n=1 Tax=Phormidium sp. FACHB-1136 TaxID=2692848 RepID=UPI0016887B19|nr:threonine-phosphate decarboxylase CobD [Phormidium sp. FACHB-1136]MBD2426422.1 threonine-phosphate decarboxylase [Phormidium sp. FACHB-1136]